MASVVEFQKGFWEGLLPVYSSAFAVVATLVFGLVWGGAEKPGDGNRLKQMSLWILLVTTGCLLALVFGFEVGLNDADLDGFSWGGVGQLIGYALCTVPFLAGVFGGRLARRHW